MHWIIVDINHLINCSAIAQKPKTAVLGPVTAELALRAHFSTADKYLKDTTLAQLAQTMFLQVQLQCNVSPCSIAVQ